MARLMVLPGKSLLHAASTAYIHAMTVAALAGVAVLVVSAAACLSFLPGGRDREQSLAPQPACEDQHADPTPRPASQPT
jgi:hypothetical protein